MTRITVHNHFGDAETQHDPHSGQFSGGAHAALTAGGLRHSQGNAGVGVYKGRADSVVVHKALTKAGFQHHPNRVGVSKETVGSGSHLLPSNRGHVQQSSYSHPKTGARAYVEGEMKGVTRVEHHPKFG